MALLLSQRCVCMRRLRDNSLHLLHAAALLAQTDGSALPPSPSRSHSELGHDRAWPARRASDLGWARMPGPGAGPRRYQGDIMKKQVKKLMLAKETVRNLAEPEMKN